MALASTANPRIQICGPLVIERGSERLDRALPGRQGRLAFTYLVVHRHRPVSRDELAAAVWPDGTQSGLETGLNPLLSKLRKALGAQAIEGRATLRLHLPTAWVDLEAATEAIHRAESSIAQGDWLRAWGPSQVALFIAEREILPGQDANWIDDIRRQLTDIRIRALECYATSELGVGGAELGGAVRAARQLVRLAPLRESGHRTLMNALTAEGNLAEALHTFSLLRTTLREQLGVSPSPATQALHAHLLQVSR